MHSDLDIVSVSVFCRSPRVVAITVELKVCSRKVVLKLPQCASNLSLQQQCRCVLEGWRLVPMADHLAFEWTRMTAHPITATISFHAELFIPSTPQTVGCISLPFLESVKSIDRLSTKQSLKWDGATIKGKFDYRSCMFVTELADQPVDMLSRLSWLVVPALFLFIIVLTLGLTMIL